MFFQQQQVSKFKLSPKIAFGTTLVHDDVFLDIFLSRPEACGIPTNKRLDILSM